MPAHEIIVHLGAHGCQAITHLLDVASCSASPLEGGGFGDVYRGRLIDNTPVAIKTMRFQIASSTEGHKSLKRAARELYVWSKCQHPNVHPLLGVVAFKNQVGMVSKWMERGNLRWHVNQNPDVNRCKMSEDIATGLAYLHRIGIVHGDLKGLNILISSDGAPMLTDFGNSVLQNCSLKFTTTTTRGNLTIRWAAPELIDDREGTHDHATDVYALGMVILETFTGADPYHGKSEARVVTLIMSNIGPGRPEEQIPSDSRQGNALWSLLLSCWASEPKARPTASDVAEKMGEINPDGLTRVQPEPATDNLSPVHEEHSENQFSDRAALEVAKVLVAGGCPDLTDSLSSAMFYSGTIHSGKLDDQFPVAVQSMELIADSDNVSKAQKRTAWELSIWFHCRHSNILPFIGLVVFEGRLGAVSPWIEGGDLATYTRENPRADRWKLVTGIADGLAHLHDIGIVHGDVRARSVLVTAAGIPLLGNFCNAIVDARAINWKARSTRLRWTAPELLEVDEAASSTATDVYALGMLHAQTILETLTGQAPYPDTSDRNILTLIITRETPTRPEAYISSSSLHGDTLWSLLQSCWAYKPKDRPSAAEVAKWVGIITQDDLVVETVEEQASS